MAFFERQIGLGRLKRTKKFESTKARIAMLPDERAEAKREKQKMKAEKGKGSMADLEKMILARKGDSFKGFMGYMEAKYGEEEGKKKKKGGKEEEATP